MARPSQVIEIISVIIILCKYNSTPITTIIKSVYLVLPEYSRREKKLTIFDLNFLFLSKIFKFVRSWNLMIIFFL